MSTPTRITLKNLLVGIVVIAIGMLTLRLYDGSWPNFRGLGAFGVILGMSVAWSAQEAYTAGIEEGRRRAGEVPSAPVGSSNRE